MNPAPSYSRICINHLRGSQYKQVPESLNLVHSLGRRLMLRKMRQLCPGTGELFPYHKYYIFTYFGTISTICLSNVKLNSQDWQLEINKNKTLQCVDWTSLLWHCSSHTKLHKAIVTDFFPEYRVFKTYYCKFIIPTLCSVSRWNFNLTS